MILGARIKNDKKEIIEHIHQLELSDGQISIIEKKDNTKLLVSYSNKRAEKDRFNRERGLKKLEKNLSAGRLTKSNINNRGYNKYLKMEGRISIKIDYDKYEQDAKWDGLKGYLTNTSLLGQQVVETYNNLWKIERAFRISKTDLKIRPIYHRLKDRIEAHICISFVSYVLYKELERVLKANQSEISIEKAIEQINKMYEVVYETQSGTKQTIMLKKNQKQNEILSIISSEF